MSFHLKNRTGFKLEVAALELDHPAPDLAAHRVIFQNRIGLERIKAGTRTCAFFAAFVISASLLGAGELDRPEQLYNQGTQKFREGKLREAEASLQNAVSSQNEKVQVLALYNLGHVRFQEGERELKETKDGKSTAESAGKACEAGEEAIGAANDALAQWELQNIVAAYMKGRGVRKELKAATEAVQRAMESYGVVLQKWERASGDFKSSHELSRDSDAQANAKVVDGQIARLVDTIRLMAKSSQCTKATRESLKQKMSDLKKRMPKELKQQCEKGEEEDEEDKPPKEPRPGEQEPKPKEGRERLLTPEEAARLLEMLRLDTNRKLPLGMNDTGTQQDRKRRNW